MTKKLIQKATEFCDRHKYRFTDPRKHVLEIIAKNPKALGAYEILEQLSAVIKAPKPPTVYRAIDFWQRHGFIHRIESLNAYTACGVGHRHKGSHFLICDGCGDVAEAHLCDFPQSLKETTDKRAFTPSRWNFEIHGTCINCND